MGVFLGPISQHSITAKWDDGRVITVDHPEKEIDHIIQQVQIILFMDHFCTFVLPPPWGQLLLRLWKDGHQLFPLLVVHIGVVVPGTT